MGRTGSQEDPRLTERARVEKSLPPEEVLPGVHAIYAVGHTVHHTIFMINAGKESLYYIADLTHHPTKRRAYRNFCGK